MFVEAVVGFPAAPGVCQTSGIPKTRRGFESGTGVLSGEEGWGGGGRRYLRRCVRWEEQLSTGYLLGLLHEDGSRSIFRSPLLDEGQV
jgi:hypothetical protein